MPDVINPNSFLASIKDKPLVLNLPILPKGNPPGVPAPPPEPTLPAPESTPAPVQLVEADLPPSIAEINQSLGTHVSELPPTIDEIDNDLKPALDKLAPITEADKLKLIDEAGMTPKEFFHSHPKLEQIWLDEGRKGILGRAFMGEDGEPTLTTGGDYTRIELADKLALTTDPVEQDRLRKQIISMGVPADVLKWYENPTAWKQDHINELWTKNFSAVQNKLQAEEVSKRLTMYKATQIYNDTRIYGIFGGQPLDPAKGEFAFANVEDAKKFITMYKEGQDAYWDKQHLALRAILSSPFRGLSAGFFSPGMNKDELEVFQERGTPAEKFWAGTGEAIGAVIPISAASKIIGLGLRAALTERVISLPLIGAGRIGLEAVQAERMAVQAANTLSMALYGGFSAKGDMDDKITAALKMAAFGYTAGKITEPVQIWFSKLSIVEQSKFLQYVSNGLSTGIGFMSGDQLVNGLDVSQALIAGLQGVGFGVAGGNTTGKLIENRKRMEALGGDLRNQPVSGPLTLNKPVIENPPIGEPPSTDELNSIPPPVPPKPIIPLEHPFGTSELGNKIDDKVGNPDVNPVNPTNASVPVSDILARRINRIDKAKETNDQLLSGQEDHDTRSKQAKELYNNPEINSKKAFIEAFQTATNGSNAKGDIRTDPTYMTKKEAGAYYDLLEQSAIEDGANTALQESGVKPPIVDRTPEDTQGLQHLFADVESGLGDELQQIIDKNDLPPDVETVGDITVAKGPKSGIAAEIRDAVEKAHDRILNGEDPNIVIDDIEQQIKNKRDDPERGAITVPWDKIFTGIKNWTRGIYHFLNNTPLPNMYRESLNWTKTHPNEITAIKAKGELPTTAYELGLEAATIRNAATHQLEEYKKKLNFDTLTPEAQNDALSFFWDSVGYMEKLNQVVDALTREGLATKESPKIPKDWDKIDIDRTFKAPTEAEDLPLFEQGVSADDKAFEKAMLEANIPTPNINKRSHGTSPETVWISKKVSKEFETLSGLDKEFGEHNQGPLRKMLTFLNLAGFADALTHGGTITAEMIKAAFADPIHGLPRLHEVAKQFFYRSLELRNPEKRQAVIDRLESYGASARYKHDSNLPGALSGYNAITNWALSDLDLAAREFLMQKGERDVESINTSRQKQGLEPLSDLEAKRIVNNEINRAANYNRYLTNSKFQWLKDRMLLPTLTASTKATINAFKYHPVAQLSLAANDIAHGRGGMAAKRLYYSLAYAGSQVLTAGIINALNGHGFFPQGIPVGQIQGEIDEKTGRPKPWWPWYALTRLTGLQQMMNYTGTAALTQDLNEHPYASKSAYRATRATIGDMFAGVSNRMLNTFTASPVARDLAGIAGVEMKHGRFFSNPDVNDWGDSVEEAGSLPKLALTAWDAIVNKKPTSVSDFTKPVFGAFMPNAGRSEKDIKSIQKGIPEAYRAVERIVQDAKSISPTDQARQQYLKSQFDEYKDQFTPQQMALVRREVQKRLAHWSSRGESTPTNPMDNIAHAIISNSDQSFGDIAKATGLDLEKLTTKDLETILDQFDRAYQEFSRPQKRTITEEEGIAIMKNLELRRKEIERAIAESARKIRGK